MEVSQTQASTGSSSTKTKDIGWNYARVLDKDRLQCLLCNKAFKCGISRLKRHVAGITGDIAKCSKATEEERKICKNALDAAKKKTTEKVSREEEVRERVRMEDLYDEMEEHDDCQVLEQEKSNMIMLLLRSPISFLLVKNKESMLCDCVVSFGPDRPWSLCVVTGKFIS